jgi:hypothetical protein
LCIALERGDRVSIPGQQHAEPHPYDATTDYQDIRHDRHPSSPG